MDSANSSIKVNVIGIIGGVFTRLLSTFTHAMARFPTRSVLTNFQLSALVMKSKNRRGPYLTNLGSKLSGDWLVTWLIKPDHYDASSVMPSFRLTLKEANHITSFLLKSKMSKPMDLKL